MSNTSSAERRHLTILFCDLVGSTSLAARLDAEDYRDVLVAYQRRATEVVERAGGMVARYEGDGILAYFGFPAANEDDAERAVRAGLDLAGGMVVGDALDQDLTVRVGIATGVVIVDQLMHSKAADNPAVVGEAPNLAARLQDLATPNTVLISSETRRLVGGLFEFRDLGMQSIKGFAEPLRAWQVLRASDDLNRFEALRGTSPLVGRDKELDLLLAQWQCATTEGGRVVIVAGEPGIGKSRLALEFLARIRSQSPAMLRYDCSPGHKDSMLHPLLAQMQRAAQFHHYDSPEVKAKKLEALVAGSGQASIQVVALLGDLMGLPVSGRFAPLAVDVREKRHLLFESLVGVLVDLTRRRKTAVIVEDIHWLDPTSAELLEHVIVRAQQFPIVIVLTCRPEAKADWLRRSRAAVIDLAAIDALSAEAMAKEIAGSNLPDATLRSLVDRADGMPLFIEELTKAALEKLGKESPAKPSEGSSVPPNLQATLMWRLDRLGPARDVAKVAAAIGRDFGFELLQAVMEERKLEDLRALLGALLDAKLVIPIGLSKSNSFTFRHALIQDAAYSTLLRKERKALHGQIACALQQRFPEAVAMQPEIIASHFAKAEAFKPAVRYWQQAGGLAAARGAFVETARHLSEAAKLIQLLPESQERSHQQLSVQIALGQALMATSGYAAAESLQAFMRADELAAEVGSASERMEVLLGLFDIHYNRAELEQALAVAHQHMALAEQNQRYLARAHQVLGQCYSAKGAFIEAREHFQRALAKFAQAPEQSNSIGVFARQDVVSRALIAGVHHALGEPMLARAATLKSIERARELQNPLLIALASVTQLLTPVPGGSDPDPDRAGEVIRFCSRHGLKNFEIWARFARGAIAARRGDPREGILLMQAAIGAAEDMNSRLFRPVQLACLGGAHAKIGELGEAQRLLAEAIEIADRTGERQALPSLHRVYGEILFAAGKADQGQTQLKQALRVARDQHAKAELGRIEKSMLRVGAKDAP